MASFDSDRAEPRIVVRRRRGGHVKPPHHGGAWKIAYADFVTAMMAFFMLLWLISNPDKGRLKGLAEYFSTASVNSDPAATLTSQPGSDPGIGGRRRRAQSDSSDARGEASAEAGSKGAARGGTADIPEASQRIFADEMMIALEPPPEASAGAKAKIRVDPVRDGIRISLMDTARQSIFSGPTATLNAYGRELLARVAKKLANSGGQIAIEGHTDSVGGAQSDTNWQLSSARAMSSRAAMVAAGLPADRFSEVVAKAGTQPIDAERPDRPENRRITIVVLAEPSVLPRDASFQF
ncbi:OmpA family protein [Sphingomonas sp. AP4-R1]|uniref:flagellar motor protein MotB n=1 Tax=Sphingomonas sp. AP4-R1 TaxID=2735134 RepID=UPI001493317B|nr:flagellar motor protein MotB [Sphingomonas sp. AP4-R1]QJU57461.1 OmpA family protein [Sphingomonas sp. AP4-R1]